MARSGGSRAAVDLVGEVTKGKPNPCRSCAKLRMTGLNSAKFEKKSKANGREVGKTMFNIDNRVKKTGSV